MLGERIYELRMRNKLSQLELARLLHKSKQSVSNWENNNILPSIDMLIELSRIFQVSCDYLLGIDDRKCLEIAGLTDEQMTHIQYIIDDIRNKPGQSPPLASGEGRAICCFEGSCAHLPLIHSLAKPIQVCTLESI